LGEDAFEVRVALAVHLHYKFIPGSGLFINIIVGRADGSGMAGLFDLGNNKI
jgi:hypothetical protein